MITTMCYVVQAFVSSKNQLAGVMMTMKLSPVQRSKGVLNPESTHHNSVPIHTSLTDYVTCEFSQPNDLAHPAYSDIHII